MENIQTTPDTAAPALVSPEEAVRLEAIKAQLFVTTDEGEAEAAEPVTVH